MKKHKIIWTEETWNPYPGCDKISPGCKNCYAITMAWRLAHIPATKKIYEGLVEKTSGGELNWTGKIAENIPQFDKPLRTKEPTMFFTSSMSDIFHEQLTMEQIDGVYDIMDTCQRHTFQVLTKRPQKALEYYKWKEAGNGIEMSQWPLPNVWLGVSVENQKYADERIPVLLSIPAAIRFLSCEPLLGPVDLRKIKGPAGSSYQVLEPITNSGDSNRPAISWVIAGGESGKGSRPMHPDWVRSIRDQCKKASVPFLFKQWGSWAPIDMPWEQDNIKELKDNEEWLNLAGGSGFHGEQVYRMRNVGKSKSGNHLDGFQHQEFPPVERSVATDAE